MSSITKEQCIEFARLDELRLHHWRLLTGVTGGEGDYVICNQSGIFPEQYDDRELALLTAEEAFEIGEVSVIEPLRFPCLPLELLRFVDRLVDIEVPDAFRAEVERLDTGKTGRADSDQSRTKRKRSTRGPTVKESIKPYVAELKKRFPKLTGKLLHSEAEKEAGSEFSPFTAHKWGEDLRLKNCHRPCSKATFEQVLSQIKE